MAESGVSSPGFGHRSLAPVKTGRHPKQWNDEVVRALSARLPYGRFAATTKCVVCRSIFNPCLCAKKGEGPSAPRIVEEAEAQRFSGHGMGSLTNVKVSTFIHGMDRSRLIVAGETPTPRLCSVLSRHGATYVVGREDEQDWIQDVRLSKAELAQVVSNLKGSAIRAAKYPTEQDRCDHGLTLKGKTELLPERRVAKEFWSLEEAQRSLSFVMVPVSASPHGLRSAEPEINYWFVVTKSTDSSVKPGWLLSELKYPKPQPENRCGPVGGSLTARLPAMKKVVPDYPHLRQLLATDQRAPGAKASPGGGAPSAREAPRRGAGDQGECPIRWPCTFVFSLLPPGWIVSALIDPQNGDEHKPRSAEDLDNLIGGFDDEALTLRFRRKPLAVVEPNDSIRLRHEHLWEREVAGKRGDQDRLDFEVLYQWGVNSRMRPWQLEWIFKKLIDTLSEELKAFEAKRIRYEQSIVQKGVRYSEMSEFREEAAREMRELFERCPLYFIYEIRDGCQYNPNADDSALGHSIRVLRSSMSRSFGAPPPKHHGGEGGRVHPQQAAKTYQRLLNVISEEVNLSSCTRPSGLLSRSMMKTSVESILEAIGSVAVEYLTAVEEGRAAPDEALASKVPGRIEVRWNAAGTAFHREYPGRNDGRLSFDEFCRILHTQGISWLTREELERNFSVIDVDGSKYLSLGEVLRVSERMLDRIRALTEFEREHPELADGPRRKVHFADLLTLYIREHYPHLDLDVDASPPASPRAPAASPPGPSQARLPAETGPAARVRPQSASATLSSLEGILETPQASPQRSMTEATLGEALLRRGDGDRRDGDRLPRLVPPGT